RHHGNGSNTKQQLQRRVAAVDDDDDDNFLTICSQAPRPWHRVLKQELCIGRWSRSTSHRTEW
ncbi:hypothetical protein EE612_060794, partial [Oryza sativa]